MSTWSYRPELDGLRTVAVYLVVLFHAGLAGFGGGFVGVDLFFVLSGFLVTHVIWAEVDARQRLSLSGFWSRRVRRLLPAAILVVVVTALVQLLVVSQPTRVDFVGDARAALLYFANWHFLAESTDYFAAGTAQESPYLHFWSLSIEEQFYIAYPLLLVALLARRSRAAAARLAGVVLALVLVTSLALQLLYAASDPTAAYYATHTRVYQLAAGALLAMVVRGTWSTGHAFPLLRGLGAGSARLAPWAAPAGLAGVLVLGSGLLDLTPAWRGILVTLAATVTIAGLHAAPGLVGRVLGSPLPRYLGQISYGTYLWHWPVILVLREVFASGPLVIAGLATVLSTALAALSFTVLESPVRRARLGPRTRWPVVAVGLAASVVVATLVTPVVLENERRPAVSAARAPGAGAGATATGARLDRPVPPGLDLLAAHRDIPELPGLCTPEDPDGCTLVEGDGPHVVLVGDSQGQTFLDAFEQLARERDWTFSASIRVGCPWEAELRHADHTDDEREKCTLAREVFYEEVLPDLDADLVITIGLARTSSQWRTKLVDVSGGPELPLAQRNLRAIRTTVEMIRAAGPRLVLAHTQLNTNGYQRSGPDPLDCLARARVLADCAVAAPLQTPYVDGFYETVAADDDGVATVDFNPAICPGAPVCSPVIGDTVVWRDDNHVTGRVLLERRGVLLRQLRRSGLLPAA